MKPQNSEGFSRADQYICGDSQGRAGTFRGAAEIVGMSPPRRKQSLIGPRLEGLRLKLRLRFNRTTRAVSLTQWRDNPAFTSVCCRILIALEGGVLVARVSRCVDVCRWQAESEPRSCLLSSCARAKAG